jgi:hypothetical protein
MGKIYSTQRFHIYFNYTELPGTFVSAVIKFKRPSGTTGSFTAEHNTETKQLYYNSPANEKINIPGTWVFWAVITIDDGETIPSNPIVKEIFKEGT